MRQCTVFDGCEEVKTNEKKMIQTVKTKGSDGWRWHGGWHQQQACGRCWRQQVTSKCSAPVLQAGGCLLFDFTIILYSAGLLYIWPTPNNISVYAFLMSTCARLRGITCSFFSFVCFRLAGVTDVPGEAANHSAPLVNKNSRRL